jgi:hypothetical protein
MCAFSVVLTDSGTGYPDIVRPVKEAGAMISLTCPQLFSYLVDLIGGTFFDLPSKLSNIKQALIELVGPSFDTQLLTK